MNLKTVGVASQKVQQPSKVKQCEVGRVDFATAKRPLNPQGLTQKIYIWDIYCWILGEKHDCQLSKHPLWILTTEFQHVCILCFSPVGSLVIFSGKHLLNRILTPPACDMQRHESPPSWDAQKSWAMLMEEILVFTGFIVNVNDCFHQRFFRIMHVYFW